MRNILILFFLTLNSALSATDFYVSNSGNDSNNGTSTSSPWRTIQKVNSEFSKFNPGDRVLFRRGDIFDDATLKIVKSGSNGKPITVGAYGTGAIPVLTSFKQLTSWKSEGGKVYSASLSIEAGSVPENNKFIRIVFTIDGEVHWMGRSEGWRTINTVNGVNIFTDNSLTENPRYTGAEVVVRTTPWSVARRRITSHSGGKLTLEDIAKATELRPDYGYYFQNHRGLVDKHGEWFYDTATSKIYVYLDKAPGNYVIKAATRNSIIDITGNYNYLVFENLGLSGGNVSGIQRRIFGSGSNYLTLQNLDINYSGESGINIWNFHNSTFTNNTIKNSLGNGIYGRSDSGCNNNIITRNTIINSGLIAGVGNQGLSGIELRGTNCVFQYNKIINSGQNGIRNANPSTGAVIKNNFIDHFGLTIDDCGGIYISGDWSDRIISRNIVLNGVGNYEGTTYKTSQAIGIYNDHSSEGSRGITIEDNVVAYCGSAGYFMNGGTGLTINNNLLFANRRQAIIIGRDNYVKAENMVFTNNILIGVDQADPILYTRSYYENPDFYKKIDNNYYLRADNITTKMFHKREPSGTVYFDFKGWKEYAGGDANSKALKFDSKDIRFEYNATEKNRIVTLDKPMTDVRGNKYSNSITLLPYTAAVLFADLNATGSFSLSINTDGNGSLKVNGATASGSLSFGTNTKVSLQATPDEGWSFSHWTGNASGSANPLEVTMDRNKTITAVFTEETYSVIIIPEGEGSVEMTPGKSGHARGKQVNLKATAEKDWQFVGWEGDITSVEPELFFLVEHDMVITARFEYIGSASNISPGVEENVLIYPNPARDFFSISVESASTPEMFRIMDLTGRIHHKGSLEQKVTDIPIPGSIKPGIYIIELIFRNLPFYSQRLVITK
jgi:hypothetical protein